MKNWILKDYYHVLGVPRNSNKSQLKKAYRRLVRKNHPDYNPLDPNCEERLREINESYEALTNLSTRHQIDRWLDEKEQDNSTMVESEYNDRETIFSHEKALNQEWDKTRYGSKLFAVFCLPTVLYLTMVRWESIHLLLDHFVILFVGGFYIALFFAAKVIFHGTTVLVMKASETRRPFVQVMMIFLLFVLPIYYFVPTDDSFGSGMISFANHTWYWFFYAGIIIGLALLFGIYFRSPLSVRFPFRLNILAVFLTFVITFFKAIPLVDKSGVFFDYIFFNITLQTGLFLAYRWKCLSRSSI